MDILLEPFSNFGFDWICILRRIEKGAAVDDLTDHFFPRQINRKAKLHIAAVLTKTNFTKE